MDGWDLHVDVDAVHEGGGDLGVVAVDPEMGAVALPLGIGQKPLGQPCSTKPRKFNTVLHATASFGFPRILPRDVFARGYPESSRTVGEQLRKARMNAKHTLNRLNTLKGITQILGAWEM